MLAAYLCRGGSAEQFAKYPLMRRGLTLVEVLVFSALSLLLIGLIIRLVLPSIRASGRASTQVELQQMATHAILSLSRDLARCNGSSISVSDSTGVGGLAYVRSAGVSSSGRRVWEEVATFVVRLPEDRRLIRQTYPPSPPELGVTFLPSLAPSFSPSDLAEVASQPNPTRRNLASEVEEFEVSHLGSGHDQFTPPLRIRLKLQKQVASNQVESFEMVREYALRN